MVWRRLVIPCVFSFWNYYVSLKCTWTNLNLLKKGLASNKVAIDTVNIADFWAFIIYFHYVPIKCKAFPSSKLEFPLLHRILRQILLKSAQWIWKRRFSQVINISSLRRYYLPKGTKFPIPKEALFQILFK